MLVPIWGLLYKDFAANKNMIIYAIVFVFFSSFVSLVYCRQYPVAIYAGAVMIYLAGSFLPETASITDRESRWNVYAMTLPTAAGKTVLVKYLLFAGMYALCFVLSVILTGVGAWAFGSGFSIYPLAAIFGFIVAFDSISYAFVFSFGPRRGAAFKAVAVFSLPCAGLLYLLFGDLTVFGDGGIGDFIWWLAAFDLNDFIGMAWVWFLVAAAVCWAAGYAVSRKWYLKGIVEK